MAKINFAATQVGEHRNVLGFRGAILNNDARKWKRKRLTPLHKYQR